LRARFGIEEGIHLFYNKNKRQFIQFSTLIDNLKSEIEFFKPLSDAADQELADKLHQIRYQSNAGAHSLEKDITKEDVDEYSDMIEQAATILFDLREKSLDEENVSPSSTAEEDQPDQPEPVGMNEDLFQVPDSEILSEHAGTASELFRFSGENDLHINESDRYSLKQKATIYFLAYRYAEETGLMESSVVSVNDLISGYNLDMETAWQLINEIDCLKDVNRADGEFKFDAQKLPETLPKLVSE